MVCPFKLRIRDLDADDRGHSFTDVLAGEIYLDAFQEIVGSSIRLKGAGESTLEATLVEPTFSGTNVVGVGANIFCVGRIELKGDFYCDFRFDTLDVNGIGMQDFFVLVMVGNEGSKSTVVLKSNGFRAFIIASVVKLDAYAFVKEGEFS